MNIPGYLRSFYRDFKVALEERGWSMPWGGLRLAFKYFFVNYVLSQCARHVPSRFSSLFHRLRGVRIGKDVYVDSSVIIDEAYPENITIEDDVRIAANTVIVSHIKAGLFLRNNFLPSRVARVRICRYSFIGANVTILPGVTLGEGCVVVSGSVVMRDVEPYTVVSGIPAKRVKKLARTGATES